MVQRVENVFQISSDEPHDIFGRSIFGAFCLAAPPVGAVGAVAWVGPCIFRSSIAIRSTTSPVSYVHPVKEHRMFGMARRHDVKLRAHKQIRLSSPLSIGSECACEL